MTEVKYLDKTGLTSVWSKVKGIVTPKADKVSGATAGHLAGLNSSGNLTDSGLPASNIAQKDGSYSGMTVGAAEDLVSAESVASEFTSRITGGSTAVGKGGTALVDRIKGRTFVWNQLVQKNWFPTSSGSGLTLTNNGDGTYTINGTSESNYRFYAYTGRTSWSDHKYYCALSDSNLKMYFDGSPSNAGNALQKQIITTNASNTYFPILYFPNGSSYSNLRFTVIIIDLTLMFGAGNEPSTVADFEALYPLPYYAYNPGELINNGLQSEYDLVWNQLADDSSLAASGTTNGITFTKSGHVISVTGTASNTAFSDNAIGLYLVSLTSGHKYYLGRNLNFAASLDTCYIQLYSASLANWAATSIGAHGNIFTAPSGATTATDIRMRVRVNTGTVISSSSPLNCTLQLYDLTTMFGAGNEPTTPEEFEAMFPADYYSYDTGTEQHFSFPQFKTKIETVGWNIWDEEWEVGGYNSDGSKSSSTNYRRGKSAISVTPSTTYYYHSEVNRSLYYIPFDINGNVISAPPALSNNSAFTTPSNCVKILIQFYVASIAWTTDERICISLSDPTRNGTYEPYWRSELELGLGDIKVKSPNIWDEEWENGQIDQTTGQNTGNSYVRSKNYIPCKPRTNYYFYKTTGFANIRVFQYDSNQLFIREDAKTNVATFNLTSESNCAYLRFYIWTDTSYGNNVTICETGHGFEGHYFPYGDGGVISITGGLKSAGTVYDEVSGGKLVKRIESLDLGSLTYSYDSSITTFAGAHGLSSIAKKGAVAICAKYTQVSSIGSSTPDKVFVFMSSWSGYNYIHFKDTSYSDAATFKAAMSGVHLYYELDQPIEYELAEAIPTAMRNDPYGTERRLPEDTAAIVTAPFRADITYSTNIKEAVQSMPQNYINVNSMQDFLSALGTLMGGTWTMRQADGKFDFTFTPNPVEPTL